MLLFDIVVDVPLLLIPLLVVAPESVLDEIVKLLLFEMIVFEPEFDIPVEDKFTTVIGSVEEGEISILVVLEMLPFGTLLAIPNNDILVVEIGVTVGEIVTVFKELVNVPSALLIPLIVEVANIPIGEIVMVFEVKILVVHPIVRKIPYISVEKLLMIMVFEVAFVVPLLPTLIPLELPP